VGDAAALKKILTIFGLALIVLLAVALSLRILGTHGPARRSPSPPAAGHCAADPSACGYPDATTTGVPAGTKLVSVPAQATKGQGWYWDSRGWIMVDGNGAVVSGLSVHGGVTVTASNVTISDSQIVHGGRNAMGVSLRHTKNVTIKNNTISGADTGSGRMMTGVKDVYGDSVSTTVVGNDIAMAETGVQMSEGLIQGNYIHDMGYMPGDHTNGMTTNGGTTPMTIRHNTVLVSLGQTDAVGLFEDFGVQANRVITDNLLAGGAYSIYGGQKKDGPATYNIQITNNRISTMYFPKGGSWGPLAAWNAGGSGNVWSGNIWDNTGRPIRQL
jgi:hypothetical protein